ncbi:Scr1 family TA system antitoxin-like transcriptional regulator [Streptomyces sp. NPDC091271]|uniref:Scr1 family TA system antitoxin-like transcriptional regulator n=1 Tax=Streptomyces sp. NPDC091271 TaxID=3365980 RepID=UPI00381A77C1
MVRDRSSAPAGGRCVCTPSVLMRVMCTAEGRNLVYVEAQGGDRLISRPEQAGDMFDLFGILRAQALNPWKSAEIIETKVRRL